MQSMIIGLKMSHSVGLAIIIQLRNEAEGCIKFIHWPNLAPGLSQDTREFTKTMLAIESGHLNQYLSGSTAARNMDTLSQCEEQNADVGAVERQIVKEGRPQYSDTSGLLI